MRYTSCLLIIFLFITCWMSAAGAVTRDEEIIERLARLETAVEKMEANLQRQINDGNRNLQRQIDEIKNFILWMGSIVFAGIFALIGFVLWDRRTALAPAISKNKELEEREERLEKAIKEYALKEPKLAEVLRQVGIL